MLTNYLECGPELGRDAVGQARAAAELNQRRSARYETLAVVATAPTLFLASGRKNSSDQQGNLTFWQNNGFYGNGKSADSFAELMVGFSTQNRDPGNPMTAAIITECFLGRKVLVSACSKVL